jgi:hypothetical protein
MSVYSYSLGNTDESKPLTLSKNNLFICSLDFFFISSASSDFQTGLIFFSINFLTFSFYLSSFIRFIISSLPYLAFSPSNFSAIVSSTNLRTIDLTSPPPRPNFLTNYSFFSSRSFILFLSIS